MAFLDFGFSVKPSDIKPSDIKPHVSQGQSLCSEPARLNQHFL
jgi:hypothetical protein